MQKFSKLAHHNENAKHKDHSGSFDWIMRMEIEAIAQRSMETPEWEKRKRRRRQQATNHLSVSHGCKRPLPMPILALAGWFSTGSSSPSAFDIMPVRRNPQLE